MNSSELLVVVEDAGDDGVHPVNSHPSQQPRESCTNAPWANSAELSVLSAAYTDSSDGILSADSSDDDDDEEQQQKKKQFNTATSNMSKSSEDDDVEEEQADTFVCSSLFTTSGPPTDATDKRNMYSNTKKGLSSSSLSRASSHGSGGKTTKRNKRLSAIGLRHALSNNRDLNRPGSGHTSNNTQSTSSMNSISRRRSSHSSASLGGSSNKFGMSMRFVNNPNYSNHNNLSVAIPVEKQEEEALKKAIRQGGPMAMLLDFLAALHVYALYLVTAESILASFFAAGLTVYWYYDILATIERGDGGHTKSGEMSMVLLTFAVITPMVRIHTLLRHTFVLFVYE